MPDPPSIHGAIDNDPPGAPTGKRHTGLPYADIRCLGRVLEQRPRATVRKMVASFLDDANVSTRKISDQLGHTKVSMTQDRYLGRRLTDRQTADVLQEMFPDVES